MQGGVSPGTAKAVGKFIDYGLGAGQSVAQQLQFAPLPTTLLAKAKAAAAKLQCNGSPLGA